MFLAPQRNESDDAEALERTRRLNSSTAFEQRSRWWLLGDEDIDDDKTGLEFA